MKRDILKPLPRRCPATAKERATFAMQRAMGLNHCGAATKLSRRKKRVLISEWECHAACGRFGYILMLCWVGFHVPPPTNHETPHK